MMKTWAWLFDDVVKISGIMMQTMQERIVVARTMNAELSGTAKEHKVTMISENARIANCFQRLSGM